MADRVAVVTPWYPTLQRPFHGSFVRGFVETLLESDVSGVDVLHLEAWGLPSGRRAYSRARRDLTSLIRDPLRFPTGDIAVRHLPMPVRPKAEFGPIAAEHRRFLAAITGGRRLSHGVVHAHVGLGGGLPALELLAPTAGFFVTEHATFLARLFEDAAAVAAYDEVIARADAFLCVSDLLRTQLVERFPHHAGRLLVVPNAIDFDALPVRVEGTRVPRRWLYAGSLTERKGVLRLLDAFALSRDAYADLELTLVGEGPEREALQSRIAELGIADHVALPGAVAPEVMPATYAAHDLLVHLSRYETFGMTLVEAVATGIPVLATRCGGPEETIAPIEAAVGRLVPEDASPSLVAEAYGQLREGIEDLDLAAGRADLRARYGRAAVGSMLRRLYDGEGPS